MREPKQIECEKCWTIALNEATLSKFFIVFIVFFPLVFLFLFDAFFCVCVFFQLFVKNFWSTRSHFIAVLCFLCTVFVSWRMKKHEGIEIDSMWPRHTFILTYRGSFFSPFISFCLSRHLHFESLSKPRVFCVYESLYFSLGSNNDIKTETLFVTSKSWSIAGNFMCWNFS